MKSKYMTYFLIAVVVIVWGLVARRLFRGSEKAVQATATETVPAKKTPATRKMMLNYRDPFLPEGEPARTSPARASTLQPATPKNIRESVDLQFAGTVTGTDRINYIFALSGEYITLSPGERAAGYTFVSAGSDSLHFRRGTGEYFLAIDK